MPHAQETASFLFVALICALIEYAWRKRKGIGYDLGSLGGHLGIMVGVAISRGLTGALMAGALFASHSFAPVSWDLADWKTWVIGFFVLDFFYYWQHRFSHEVRWGWASHSVHHSTNEFTLPAAFRLSWLSFFSLSWLVYIPMALAGFSPVLITALLAVNLRFQYFLHTEAVGKLGLFELIFNTPSHHRVHHGSNPEYLDKNYGGVLIVFDRLFGTFAEERKDNPVIYGLTKKLESNNPFVIIFQEWIHMARAALKARTPKQLFRILLGRPSDDEPAPSEPLMSHSSKQAAAKPASG